MVSVLVVSPDPSVPGGVSVFIECMKRHIMQSHVDSFFVGSSGRGDESSFALFKRLIVSPLKLMKCVRHTTYDVVHINPSFDVKSLIRDSLLILALRTAGFHRIMLYFHGWNHHVQRFIFEKSLLRHLVAWVLNKSTLITVLDTKFREGLISIGVDPQRILVTRTMFEELEWTNSDFPAHARPYILFLSRFDREKGGRELMNAFERVADDFPDCDLVMAGDGEDALFLKEQALRLGISSRVFFPGYINGQEKGQYLRGCTFFALPTYYRSEGMPVAVLEAMGAGKALLVGSAGALRSIISEPENGVILEEVTDQTVEIGLRRLLSDPAFRELSGQHNAVVATTIFSARIVTAEIEQFYQRVAQC